MNRIGTDHLAREAIVYVRQSTVGQVINNVESRRRQYALVERARQLGWANVSVIDDDLGRSGSGVARPVGATQSDGVSPAEREALLRLGADVERAWHAEGATIATRKRIVRMLIEEIVVRVEKDGLDLVIRWTGDDHTALRVRKNRRGQHRWSVDADIVEQVRSLARQTSDPTIAAILNRAGTTTGKGNSWTRSRVATLRKHNNIAVYREGERAERGEATLDEAAEALNVSPATIRRLIADGVLPASQHCKGAPYVILVADL